MKRKYDWNLIKTEYITGDISASALAKKYGISYQTLYRRVQIERWNEMRKAYLGSVVEKCADNAACIAAIKLSKELDIANKLSEVLLSAANDGKQFNRHIVKGKAEDGRPVTEEYIFDKLDMDSLNNAIKALKSLEEIKRVMYEAISSDDKKTESRENETGVVMLPEIEEENNEIE